MSNNYTELKDKIDNVRNTLQEKVTHLGQITPQDRATYPNPQLRMWSGDIRALSDFATGLDEWLREPQVAEARRLLLELARWAEGADRLQSDDVYRDWRFLSDSVSTIAVIHQDTGTIPYDGIRQRVASWVINRIIEKDLESASRWASNARQFGRKVADLESTKVASRLADEVKKDSVRALLEVTSYDKSNDELVEEYVRLMTEADELVTNRPQEIGEKAILNTYRIDDEIEGSLNTVSQLLGSIRKLLVDLEWVIDFRGFDDFKPLWSRKKAACRANDLARICDQMKSLAGAAGVWKSNVKRRMEDAVAKARRMSRSLSEGDSRNATAAVEQDVNSIDWTKPDLKSLLAISGAIDELLKGLRSKLVEKIQNEDAIFLVEDPEVIADVGDKMGWDLDRFMKALEVVLRYGLVEIRAKEET